MRLTWSAARKSEALGEQLASSLDAFLERFDVGINGVGRGDDRQVAGVDEFDRLAHGFGQVIDASAELLGLLSERVALPKCDGVEPSIEFGEHSRVGGEWPPTRLSCVLHHQDLGNAAKPGRQRPGAVVVIKPPPGDEHDFLEQVVNRLVCPEETSEVRLDHVGVFKNENLEHPLGVLRSVGMGAGVGGSCGVTGMQRCYHTVVGITCRGETRG